MSAEPCVWEPITVSTGKVSDILCDNCNQYKDEHCAISDCRVCTGEYHICVEKEGKLMQ